MSGAFSLRHRHLTPQERLGIEFRGIEPSSDVADVANLQSQRSGTHEAPIDYESEFSLVAVSILLVEDGLHITKVTVK